MKLSEWAKDKMYVLYCVALFKCIQYNTTSNGEQHNHKKGLNIMTSYQKGIIVIAVLAIVSLTMIAVSFLKSDSTEPYSDTSTPAEAFVTTREHGSISTEIQELISKSKNSREEASSIVKIADAVITTTEIATEKTEEVVRVVPGDYIGTFTLTAYEWTGERMANGEYPYYGACASNYFALGTVLYIDGYGVFTVKDRGGPLMGNNIIDIYLGDADACWEFGVRTADVYYG